MTSSPLERREGRERERKTVCTHPSMSISNYSSTNHQPGSIGSGWEGREGLKMLAERQKNNWSIGKDGFCHFEMGWQRVLHSHLLRVISSKSGFGWHISPSHGLLITVGIVLFTMSRYYFNWLSVWRDHLQRMISNNDLSPLIVVIVELFHYIISSYASSTFSTTLRVKADLLHLLHTWGE